MKLRGKIVLAVAVIAAAGGLASCSLRSEAVSLEGTVPAAPVTQGEFQVEVDATGELRATRTAMLVAPAVAGGALQIIRLAATGAPVETGHVVVAFDPSEQEYNLEQSRSDYEQAQQEIVKATDDTAVQQAEDQTALLKAQFAVRQAQLDVSKNELVSAIDARKNLLALDEAKRGLAQLQQDIQSHGAAGHAAIALAREKSNKARLAIELAQRNIDSMQVRSPIDGLVVVRPNVLAMGGIFFGGMTLPDYQPGDQANPGSVIADVVDIRQMEISAQVSQADRANVRAGQKAVIRVDAVPGRTFAGTVLAVAGSASRGFFGAGPQAKIDVTIALDRPQSELRPGFTAQVEILGDRLENALLVPREAVFERDGGPAVYVKSGTGFEPRAVRIRYLTAARAVVAGLAPGVQVALVNPEQKPAQGGPLAGPAATAGGKR